MRKMWASAVLLGIVVCGSALTTQVGAQGSSDASLRLAAFIDAEYGPFTRDYVHVLLGHQACAYSFVDEPAFRSLADLQLQKMAERGAELIAESTAADAQQLSDADRQYAARLAVRTAMQLRTSAITTELESQYGSGEADCALSAEKNAPRYQALQVYASPQ